MYDLYNKGLVGNVAQPSIHDISQQALDQTADIENAPESPDVMRGVAIGI
jgi:hypothetical protein